MSIILKENVVQENTLITRKNFDSYGLFGFVLAGKIPAETIEHDLRDILDISANQFFTAVQESGANTQVVVALLSPGIVLDESLNDKLSTDSLALFNDLQAATPLSKIQLSAPVPQAPAIPPAPVRPADFSPEDAVKTIIDEYRKAGKEPRATEIYMQARVRYNHHWQAFVEKTAGKPSNLLRDLDWQALGVQQFKFALPDMERFLNPHVPVTPVPQTPVVPVPQPPAPVQQAPAAPFPFAAPQAPAPQPPVAPVAPQSPVPQPPVAPTTKSKDQVFGKNKVKIDMTVRAMEGSGQLTGMIGELIDVQGCTATMKLDDGTALQIHIDQLGKGRRRPVGSGTETPDQPGEAAPSTDTVAAPGAAVPPATAETTGAPAAPGLFVFRYAIIVNKKDFAVSPEVFPNEAEAGAAAEKKIEALKLVLPDIHPTYGLRKVAVQVSVLTVGDQSYTDMDARKLAEATVQFVSTSTFASVLQTNLKFKAGSKEDQQIFQNTLEAQLGAAAAKYLLTLMK